MQKSMLAKISLTVGVVLGGGGFLVYSSVGQAQHYKMVDELVGQPKEPLDHWKDKELKVHGFVEAGSITEAVVNQEMQRTFILQKGGKKIRVFSKGPKPDTFKDQSEVVATGHLVPATQVQELAVALCERATHDANGVRPAACPVHADAEQAWVVDSTDLMAKCPSKYDGAISNKIDTSFK